MTHIVRSDNPGAPLEECENADQSEYNSGFREGPDAPAIEYLEEVFKLVCRTA
jgi:hypothetical protein